MTFKKTNLIPVFITGAIMLVVVGLHIISRILGSTVGDGHARLIEQIEAITYDARVKLGARYNDFNNISDKMATLLFDDFAVEKVNDGSLSYFYAPATNDASAQTLYPRLWPWPRFIHGQIVRELAAEGAIAIGFDTMFPELSPEKAEESVDDAEFGHLSSDEFFAVEMGRAGNVFLGVEDDTLPATLFRTNAAALASIVAQSDNAVLRRVKPFHEIRLWNPLVTELVKPVGLQLSLAQVFSNRVIIPIVANSEQNQLFTIPLNPNGSMKMTSDGQIDTGNDPANQGPMDQYPFEEKRIWNLGITLAAHALGLDLERPEFGKHSITLRGKDGLSRTIPVDSGGYFYIDWSIRFQDLKAEKTPIYFGQLFPVMINDRFRMQGEPNDQNPFKDKVVLIGSVAKGNNMSDFGSTPLESQTPLVTKHLNIANSILTGRFVKRPSLFAESLLIVGLGFLSALLTWRMRVLIASIAIAGLSLCYIGFTIWMYLDYRYWIPLVLPLNGGLLLPHFGLVTYRVMFEQKEQRRVRAIFSKIVSPDVVQELLSAEKLSLGGARRKITVFFADVRGFTEFTDSTQQTAEDFVAKSTLSEAQRQAYFDRIAAEQLATVNLYLAIIADTIKNHRGTLDKYMGDCVMAFWGSPTPNKEHALCCVLAAIDSQRALYELNQQRFAENEQRKKDNLNLVAEGKLPLPLLPLLSLGTGINTGYATVGLMGSDATILNYTVFGREVNLASRLEGASGRGRILISEATLAELKNSDAALAASCVSLAPITPKGFRNAVRIYEVPWKPVSTAPSEGAVEASPSTVPSAPAPIPA